MVGVKVYDNGGKTIDRYTIIINNGKTEDFYGMSDDPFSPLGFNQYSHSWPIGGGKTVCKDKRLKEEEIPEEVKRAIYLRQI